MAVCPVSFLLSSRKTIDTMRITKVIGKLDSEFRRKIDLDVKIRLRVD